MLRPVSCASCSRMWRVGLGVAAKAALSVSSCLALMVVRGPRRFVPEFCSSFSLLAVSLSDEVELSVSLGSSCNGSWRSGDKLRSVQEDTAGRTDWGQWRQRELSPVQKPVSEDLSASVAGIPPKQSHPSPGIGVHPLSPDQVWFERVFSEPPKFGSSGEARHTLWRTFSSGVGKHCTVSPPPAPRPVSPSSK